MNNNNINNNNKPTFRGSVNKIVGGVSDLFWASWDNTGGKVVAVFKESVSKLSSVDDVSDVKKIDIEKREVNVPNNNNDEDIIIGNNNVISGNVSKEKESYNSRKTDEEKFLEELDKEYETESKKDEGYLREWIISKETKVDDELIAGIVNCKGGIKIRSESAFKVQCLFRSLEKYVDERRCEFPIIKELHFGVISYDEFGQLSKDSGISFVVGKIERLVIDSFELTHTIGEQYLKNLSNKPGKFNVYIIESNWKVFTSLEELKIVNFTCNDKEVKNKVGDSYENSFFMGLNFYALSKNKEGSWERMVKGWEESNLVRIFLPAWLLEGFDRLKGQLDSNCRDTSYICGLESHPAVCLSSEESRKRYLGCTHEQTCLLSSDKSTKYVEFIFE